MKVDVEHFLSSSLTIGKQEVNSLTPDPTFSQRSCDSLPDAKQPAAYCDIELSQTARM